MDQASNHRERSVALRVGSLPPCLHGATCCDRHPLPRNRHDRARADAPGAHVFELLRKMALPEAQYHIVQDIYRGWWIVGLLLPAALIANAALAIAVRDDGSARGLAIGAAALLLINLIVFAVWTLPVNRVTSD